MMSGFVPAVFCSEPIEEPAIWLAFQAGKLLMFDDEQGDRVVPVLRCFSETGVRFGFKNYLGTWSGQHCFAVWIPESEPLPPHYFLCGLRELALHMPEQMFMLAGRGLQVVEWDRSHQFCSCCGTATVNHDKDRAKLCPACGYIQYPRLAPCVIVLIKRGKQLLLARSPRFPEGVFSTLAGFIEPGETVEDAVHREIFEEVGLRVKNLQYKASQPWPFPHSLMIGFHAEFDGGEIYVDNEEIVEAHWFDAQSLPNIPPKGTISRHLIDIYLNTENERPV